MEIELSVASVSAELIVVLIAEAVEITIHVLLMLVVLSAVVTVESGLTAVCPGVIIQC